jgi:hypothetical protein
VLPGPVTKAEWAVGTPADSAVAAGHGLSAVANPWATAQLRMSVTTSAPLASTKTLRMPLPTSEAEKVSPRTPRTTSGPSSEPPVSASRGATRSSVRR